METGVKGTAMAIEAALLTAESIQQGQLSLADFAQKIDNTEYKVVSNICS